MLSPSPQFKDWIMPVRRHLLVLHAFLFMYIYRIYFLSVCRRFAHGIILDYSNILYEVHLGIPTVLCDVPLAQTIQHRYTFFKIYNALSHIILNINISTLVPVHLMTLHLTCPISDSIPLRAVLINVKANVFILYENHETGVGKQ